MLDRPGQRITWASAALTVALATACSEPPSYVVRWKLVDEDALGGDFEGASELTSVKQCADVGVSKVRITTRRANNTVADVSEFPCFPGDAEIAGLPVGEYTVEIEGLRRTGEPWTCTPDPDPNAPVEPCIALDEGSVSVAEGQLGVVDALLLRPPECDDGIDNDRDGRVDGKDPGCVAQSLGISFRQRGEADEAGAILVDVSVSFLDNPGFEPEFDDPPVAPTDVGVQTLVLELGGQPFMELPVAQLDLEQWPYRLPLLSGDPSEFGTGELELSIVGAAGDGTPLTVAKQQSFLVTEGGGSLSGVNFEFAAADFLAPIEAPASFNAVLLLAPDDLTGPSCALGGLDASIERLWLRVTEIADDGQLGANLDAAALGLRTANTGAVPAIDEVDGWVSVDCPTAALFSDPLIWGYRLIEFEARIGAAVCFTSAGPYNFVPGPTTNYGLERILVDGAPPPGCEECVVDDDCSGQVCVAGLCEDIIPS